MPDCHMTHIKVEMPKQEEEERKKNDANKMSLLLQ
jgi:hypothetical protein